MKGYLAAPSVITSIAGIQQVFKSRGICSHVTGIAGIGNGFTLTAAGRACLLHLEQALLHTHLAGAAAGAAGDRAGAFLRAGTIAGIAG